MTSQYRIESGVPIPPRFRPKGTGVRPRGEMRLALDELKNAGVGDSVIFPGERSRQKLCLLAATCGQALGKGNYTIRKVEGGYRVWKKG